MPTQRDHSKQNWNSSGTLEEINSGCLQRIADATEKMASNYTALQNEVESLRKARDWYMEERNKKMRTISALQGVITKLKKKK